MTNLSKLQKDLKSVLLYTEQLLAFNEKTIFDVTQEPYPHFYEHQVAGLEAVEVNFDTETWLKLSRLREVPPPAPHAMFDGWVVPVAHPTPDSQPSLADHRVLRLPTIQITDLVEAGVLDSADVLRPIVEDQEKTEEMDAIFRLEKMTELRDAWQQYIDEAWAAWAKAERPRRISIDLYNKLYQIHQRILSFGDDNPIELVFGLGIARWDCVPPQSGDSAATRLNVPLIEQLVEIELEENGALLVRPRTMQPLVALQPFHALEIEGSKTLQRDAGAELERVVEDQCG